MPIDTVDALLGAEFPVETNLLYLNHAAVAPLPARAGDAIVRLAREQVNEGSRHFERWHAVENDLRERLRTLINAPSTGDIALLKNTSEGLSFVAHGFPWDAGDNVVISNEEFPSNRLVWESLAGRGVAVREADIAGERGAEHALMNQVDARTRMLAVSSVQYASGRRLDLQRLGAFCREKNIAFCVDAIQALGQIHQDVQQMHVDFMVADAHKWMLGPEGIALFYCAAPWRERLTLHEYGWHMVEHAGDFDRREWRPAPSGRRFECGTANMLGIFGFAASLELLLEIGMDTVEQRVLARAEHLFGLIDRHRELECLTPTTPGAYAGIVTLRHRDIPAETLFKRLRERGVICAMRGGGIRFSPHCYNRLETLDQAVNMLLST